jgi:hypothetical protein
MFVPVGIATLDPPNDAPTWWPLVARYRNLPWYLLSGLLQLSSTLARRDVDEVVATEKW